MLGLMLSILLGIFGGLLLKIFYSMVEKEEPESYLYNLSKLQRTKGRVAIQYIGFRVLPVFVVTSGVVVTAERVGLCRQSAYIACVTTFSALSSVRSMIDRMRSELKGAPFHYVLQVIDIVVSFFVGALCVLLYKILTPFVPEPQEFVSAAWTALFVALIYRGTRKASRAPDNLGITARVKLVREDVGVDLWEQLRTIADEKQVPWCLLAAIVMVEVGERPRWMRRCERVVSALLLHKVTMSFGVTQEQSKRALSDREALIMACDWIRAEFSPHTIAFLRHQRQGSSGGPGGSSRRSVEDLCFDEVERIAETRNPDGNYGRYVKQCARELYRMRV